MQLVDAEVHQTEFIHNVKRRFVLQLFFNSLLATDIIYKTHLCRLINQQTCLQMKALECLCNLDLSIVWFQLNGIKVKA